MIQNLYSSYRDNTYNSLELTGASLNEALARYNRYESKLKDTVKPNEDTLRKLSNQPHYTQQTFMSAKSNFNMFPNGGLFTFRRKNYFLRIFII